MAGSRTASHRSLLQAYWRFQWFLIAFAIVYPLVSLTTLVASWSKAKNEIFPIFSWALYCFVPGAEQDYGLLISRESEEGSKPTYFEEAWELQGNERDIYYRNVQELGAAFVAQDAQQVAERRRLLEAMLRRRAGPSQRYFLVQRRFDPGNPDPARPFSDEQVLSEFWMSKDSP